MNGEPLNYPRLQIEMLDARSDMIIFRMETENRESEPLSIILMLVECLAEKDGQGSKNRW